MTRLTVQEVIEKALKCSTKMVVKAKQNQTMLVVLLESHQLGGLYLPRLIPVGHELVNMEYQGVQLPPKAEGG